jgi:hypothetical protein
MQELLSLKASSSKATAPRDNSPEQSLCRFSLELTCSRIIIRTHSPLVGLLLALKEFEPSSRNLGGIMLQENIQRTQSYLVDRSRRMVQCSGTALLAMSFSDESSVMAGDEVAADDEQHGI